MNNHFTTKRTFKHLSDIQRGGLEEMAKNGHLTQAQMAEKLQVSQSAISRELKRGRTCQMKTNRTYYDCYLADAGARVYRENRSLSHARDFHKYSENLI
ncbi:IS30 family transposase [Oikeobacillus pervagus]|uniref:IS30 family transposase n=1 Tax=Oikeobacillus pervagus TaxID=1325931 RepID=A0AAJ1T8F2_9BACI|nr:helix-turn-helix domain-containing protein [Oikeobacillus pervagus]MDQ0216515.1 IS30 family transposase [Oikeobacillus pervagus]